TADRAAPNRMAPDTTATPRRRCTRSRSTSAKPIMVTPDGAISPGATGIRQGPSGTHVVPAWPISQLAAGIVSANRARNTIPSNLRRASRFSFVSISLPFRKSVGPQLAGRALSAAVAPGMPARTVAEIAGVGLLDHQVDQRGAADFVAEFEGRRLVDPHQR